MSKKRTGETLADLLGQSPRERVGESVVDLNLQLRPQQTIEVGSREERAKSAKRKHTIYLSESQSRKLRMYAARNDAQLSRVVEVLIEHYL